MQKALYKSIILPIITLQLSCSTDFLDVKPKGQVIATQVSDYNNLLEYSRLTQITSGQIFLNTWNILGDDVAALEPHYSTPARFGAPDSRNHRLFEWADDIYRADEDTEEVNAFYYRVYTVNKIINEVMEATGGSEQQKLQYRAEALAHRAFAYFNLINFFAVPYSTASAANDPGIPLILEGDFTQTDFKRASVQEVYGQMINDLETAIPHLPIQQNTSNRYCRSAGQLLLGKIHLFMGNPVDASDMLEQALANLPERFTVSGNIGLIDYNTARLSPAPLGYVFITPLQVGNIASQGHGYPETLKGELATGMTWLGQSSPLVISPDTYALFTADDRRTLLYTNGYSPLAPGPSPTLPAGLYRSRAGFLGGNIGANLADLYLLLAEAHARTNNISAAHKHLITLRSKRMPDVTAAAVPSGQEALIRFIIDERRREFATLGYRWFDMRRLSVDPLFATAQYTHTVYDAQGNVTQTYSLTPQRMVLRFSEKLVLQSPQLVNNP